VRAARSLAKFDALGVRPDDGADVPHLVHDVPLLAELALAPAHDGAHRGVAPFIIADETGRDERVPRERIHQYGVIAGHNVGGNVRQIADLAMEHHLPTIHPSRAFVEAGGLMAYGPSIYALGQRAAWYVDQILKGRKAADLPVEQPSRFELIVNAKTAKAHFMNRLYCRSSRPTVSQLHL